MPFRGRRPPSRPFFRSPTQLLLSAAVLVQLCATNPSPLSALAFRAAPPRAPRRRRWALSPLAASPDAAAPLTLSLAGRRCLRAPRRRPLLSSSPPPPPLLLLGGMAQSVRSWEPHLPSLSAERDVLVCECLGQGPDQGSWGTCDPRDGGGDGAMTLDRHAEDLGHVIREAFGGDAQIDLAGFSLGGRIGLAALAAAAGESAPPLSIRRMHLTGVGAERDGFGEAVVQSWRDALGDHGGEDDEEEARRLRAFAWSAVLATHSPHFLSRQGPDRIRTWVDGICSQSTAGGMRSLLRGTHGEEDEWSPAGMARRISQAPEAGRTRGRICVGGDDRMVPPGQALRLGELLGWGEESVRLFRECGHAVPTEMGRAWREDLLDFLAD